MANRTMQAKALKLKRMKRLFPRHLSADYIPTGKPPDRFVIQEYKERTRSLAFDDKYLAALEARQRYRGVPPGRVEVIAHVKRIQQTIPSMHCISICDMPAMKCQLFYNAERNRFCLLEFNYLICTVRTSMFYQDKVRCIEAWKADKVRWVEFSSLCSPETKDQD